MPVLWEWVFFWVRRRNVLYGRMYFLSRVRWGNPNRVLLLADIPTRAFTQHKVQITATVLRGCSTPARNIHGVPGTHYQERAGILPETDACLQHIWTKVRSGGLFNWLSVTGWLPDMAGHEFSTHQSTRFDTKKGPPILLFFYGTPLVHLWWLDTDSMRGWEKLTLKASLQTITNKPHENLQNTA